MPEIIRQGGNQMEKINTEELENVSGGSSSAQSSRKVKCPKCGKSVSIPSPAPSYVKCLCGTKITIIKKPI